MGDEFQINTLTVGDQQAPDVAVAADGTFVVVWQGPDTELTGIFARRFNADGTPLDAAEFQVNSFMDLAQFSPTVSMNANHQFVVAWVSDHPAVSDPIDNEKSIFVQAYDSSLATSGPEILVHRFVKDAQEHPDVGIDAAGNFVVVWQSVNQDGNTWGVFARQFLADKTPVQIREFVVNSTKKAPQRYPSVGVAEDGRFVVSWQSSSDLQEGSSWDLFSQQYSADGLREGGETAINTFLEGPQIHPVVAQAPDGEYGVFWVGRGTEKSEGVHGRIFRFPDYGDAPDTYGTTLASNVEGARHAWTGPFLGSQRDREVDALAGVSSLGDDLDFQADEDGVSFLTPLIPGSDAMIQVLGSGSGLLNAWIDFDNNGVFDDGEQIFVNTALTTGWNPLAFSVPATATIDSITYARFRYSTEADLAPVGTAYDGEVEDYAIPVSGLTVTTTADDGLGSLRFALFAANTLPGLQQISFDIPGTGPQTISLLSALPTINDDVIIDATTQPGYTGNPLIELDGSLAGSDTDGLLFVAPGTVRGMIINNFTRSGIQVFQTSGVNIVSNYIGTDALGTSALGNAIFGVNIQDSQQVTVRDNVISGNRHSGVRISGTNATENLVLGNYIGTDISGTMAVSNANHGVILRNGAHQNRIGGTAAGTLNIISGNRRVGVYIADSDTQGNLLRNNHIGTDDSGSSDLGNGSFGVHVTNAPLNRVTGNVISGNDALGVAILGASSIGNGLFGNYIGTDSAGATAIPNGGHGVLIFESAHDNLIGGLAEESRNVISGNDHSGIQIAGSGTSGNTVNGNYIGLTASGNDLLGNRYHGVLVSGAASNNLITNGFVSGNGANGVRIQDAPTHENRIAQVVIGANAAASSLLGNQSYGVYIDLASGNVLRGNTISGNLAGVVIRGATAQQNVLFGNHVGTDASGTLDIGNADHGVWLSGGAHDNQIGLSSDNGGNRIAFNRGSGLAVSGSTSINNSFSRNSIYDNFFAGIDLNIDGHTLNDPGDGDTGPNLLQNYAELISVGRLPTGKLRISYHVDSLPANSSYPIRVEFFVADGSSQEGEVYLGFDWFAESNLGAGVKTIDLDPLAPVSAGQRLVASATDRSGNGNTFEFSLNQLVS